MLKRIMYLSFLFQNIITISGEVLGNNRGEVVVEDPKPVVEPEVTQEPAPTVEEKPTKAELLRELSKELGINAFNPEEVKAKFSEFNQWQESQKSEQDKLQEQLNSYNNKEEEWKKEKAQLEFKLAAVDKNIDVSKLDNLIKVTDGDITKIDDAVKEFPSFLKTTQGNTAQVRLQTKNEQGKPENKGPIYEAWLKKRNKN